MDVTPFAGKNAALEVLIFPTPRCDDSNCHDQARESFKPCVPYGWDYHPRIVPSGIWDEAYLLIEDLHSIRTLDADYRLSDDLTRCDIQVIAALNGCGDVSVELLDGDTVVDSATADAVSGVQTFTLTVHDPKLWYPVGYGAQHRYALRARRVVSTKGMLNM